MLPDYPEWTRMNFPGVGYEIGMARHGLLHRDRPVERDRAVEDDTPTTVETVERPRWAHVSTAATAGMIISVVGLCATLTGLLAPEGFALGVLGVLVSLAGMRGASRPGVTGHSLATIGVLAGLAAAVIAAVAMTGDFTWPNSKTNEITRAHDWLVDHWSWLDRWS
jgi:hypothetical protein